MHVRTLFVFASFTFRSLTDSFIEQTMFGKGSGTAPEVVFFGGSIKG